MSNRLEGPGSLTRELANPPKGRVAIADDNEALRSLLRDVLVEEGYEVVAEVDNGAEAVAMVAAHQPDFLILDQQMPYMTGTEAAQIIRSAAPQVRIVMWSDSEVDRVGCIDAEVSKHHIRVIPELLESLVG